MPRGCVALVCPPVAASRTEQKKDTSIGMRQYVTVYDIQQQGILSDLISHTCFPKCTLHAFVLLVLFKLRAEPRENSPKVLSCGFHAGDLIAAEFIRSERFRCEEKSLWI